MQSRPFGKTGESFPILSFGGQRIVDAHQCTEEQAIEIVNKAIDRGIRYFDTAHVYSDGQAESRLGKVVKYRRSEMWIATKTSDTTYDGACRHQRRLLVTDMWMSGACIMSGTMQDWMPSRAKTVP
jgi:aryl-alcohol dehydrogenase-like predicted oxidoreductase